MLYSKIPSYMTSIYSRMLYSNNYQYFKYKQSTIPYFKMYIHSLDEKKNDKIKDIDIKKTTDKLKNMFYPQDKFSKDLSLWNNKEEIQKDKKTNNK